MTYQAWRELSCTCGSETSGASAKLPQPASERLRSAVVGIPGGLAESKRMESVSVTSATSCSARRRSAGRGG